MAKEWIAHSSTSRIERVFLPDSSSTTGAGLTGLTSGSSGLEITVISDVESAPIKYTSAGSLIETITGTGTIGTYETPTATKCRFQLVHADLDGLYEIQFANAIYAVSNAQKVIVLISGATNLAPTLMELQLGQLDPQATQMAQSDVEQAANDAMVVLQLDHLLHVADGSTTTDNSIIAKMVSSQSPAAFSDFVNTTEALQALRDRGDAAWTTGAGGSDRLLLQSTTINTLATQVSFTLVAGSADDGAYEGCTIVIEDASTATQKAVGVVDTYTGTSKTVTLLEDPAIFTMAATDKIYILAEKGIKATTSADFHVDISSGGTVGLDWANIDSKTTTHDFTSTTIGTTTVNTDMKGTDSAALASVCTEGRLVELDAANLPADVDTLLTRITSTIFNGITSLAEWIGLIAGKQTGNSTARTEIRATGVGSGTFDETIESLEAIRDRGDAAWITATGFSTHTAAAVWSSGTRTLTGLGFVLANADAIWVNADNRVIADMIAIDGNTAPAVRLSRWMLAGRHGTAQSGASDRIKLSGSESSETNYFRGYWVALSSGTGQDQMREIFSYNGSTKEAIVKPDWVINPILGTEYVLIPKAPGDGSLLTAITSQITTAQTDLDTITGPDGVTLATAEDVYHADIDLSKDDGNSRDEYTVTWKKNGVRITSGITVPTIQVVKRADGLDLVASTAMTQVGSIGSYKYDEASNRITAGEAVVVIVDATIDSGSRSWSDVISRDST